jgi:hypothetical protein
MGFAHFRHMLEPVVTSEKLDLMREQTHLQGAPLDVHKNDNGRSRVNGPQGCWSLTLFEIPMQYYFKLFLWKTVPVRSTCVEW